MLESNIGKGRHGANPHALKNLHHLNNQFRTQDGPNYQSKPKYGTIEEANDPLPSSSTLVKPLDQLNDLENLPQHAYGMKMNDTYQKSQARSKQATRESKNSKIGIKTLR